MFNLTTFIHRVDSMQLFPATCECEWANQINDLTLA